MCLPRVNRIARGRDEVGAARVWPGRVGACSLAFDMVYFGHRDCEASSHSVVSCAALAACDFLAGFALHEVSW